MSAARWRRCAAVEVALQRPCEVATYREVLASLGEQCERLTSLVNGLLLRPEPMPARFRCASKSST